MDDVRACDASEHEKREVKLLPSTYLGSACDKELQLFRCLPSYYEFRQSGSSSLSQSIRFCDYLSTLAKTSRAKAFCEEDLQEKGSFSSKALHNSRIVLNILCHLTSHVKSYLNNLSWSPNFLHFVQRAHPAVAILSKHEEATSVHCQKSKVSLPVDQAGGARYLRIRSWAR